MDKDNVVYAHNGILLGLLPFKKKGGLQYATIRMSLEILFKVKLAVIERKMLHDSTYMRFLK